MIGKLNPKQDIFNLKSDSYIPIFFAVHSWHIVLQIWRFGYIIHRDISILQGGYAHVAQRASSTPMRDGVGCLRRDRTARFNSILIGFWPMVNVPWPAQKRGHRSAFFRFTYKFRFISLTTSFPSIIDAEIKEYIATYDLKELLCEFLRMR